MSETTAISWTDATWSPWEGCTKVSPGCDNCYAAGMNNWLRKGANWGPGAPRREYSEAHWAKPLKWNAKAVKDHATIRVFPSVCDPFDNAVLPSWRARFFELIDATQNIDWLLLTKRIGNVEPMLQGMARDLPPNVWLGATVVNQEEADRDIRKLLNVPARLHFLSIEPMLGPVSLHRFLGQGFGPAPGWVIVGGESGRNARPLQLEWVRNLVQQCAAVHVPIHVKQLGAVVLDSGMSSPGQHWPQVGAIRKDLPRFTEDDPPFSIALKHAKGGDAAEWPEDLRVQEFPSTGFPR